MEKQCAVWELQKVDVLLCLLCLLRFLGSFVGHDWSKNHLFLPILSNFGDCPPFQGLNVSVCVAVCVHYGALQRRKMFEKTSDMPGDQAGMHSHP